MGNFKIKSIWETKNTGGGSVPAGLENRVQAVETKATTNETSITNLQQNTAKLNQNNTFTGTNTFNTGNNLLTYTSTNTSKPDEEVLVRKNMFYAKKAQNNGFTIPANGYQSAEFTINDLTTGLNEFYVVITTSSVDIGFDVAIQVNNLNYPNSSDIKVITTSNLTNSNVDNFGFAYIGFTVYGNNKFRFRAKNTHTGPLNFNGFRVYHRIPAKITG